MRYRYFIAPVVPLVWSVPNLAESPSHHWTYSGPTGPAHWGATCNTGRAQSPIDIRTAEARTQHLPALVFEYTPTPLRIIDNGHSVQVNVVGGGQLSVGGDHFRLVQFHFHKPSEEAIDGRRFDMVVHFVHRDA